MLLRPTLLVAVEPPWPPRPVQAANFILSIGGSLFAGWALAQFLLRFAPPHLRLLASVAGFSLLAIPLLTLLGLVQALHATAISVGVGLAVIALLVTHSKSAGSPQSAWEPKQAPPVATPAWLRGACSGLLVATALPVLRRHLLRPMKFHGDDLSYHATMPAHWLQQQGFFLAPYDYHAYFPASAELFTAFFVAPTLIDTFGALAGLYWMLLAATAAYALARELGVNPALACIAPALMLVSPPFDHQASAYTATDLAAGRAGVCRQCIPRQGFTE